MLLLTRLTHRPSWLVLVSPLKASSQVLFPWICPARPHVWGLGVGGSPSPSPTGRLIPGQTNSPLKRPWGSGFSGQQAASWACSCPAGLG